MNIDDPMNLIFLGMLIGSVLGLMFSIYGWWKDPDNKHEFMNKYEYY